jgi:hypothetical protein
MYPTWRGTNWNGGFDIRSFMCSSGWCLMTKELQEQFQT